MFTDLQQLQLFQVAFQQQIFYLLYFFDFISYLTVSLLTIASITPRNSQVKLVIYYYFHFTPVRSHPDLPSPLTTIFFKHFIRITVTCMFSILYSFSEQLP